jgi:hypothetical protein
LFDFIPVSGLACSYGNIFIPPTYDLGKFKRDLGKRASSTGGKFVVADQKIAGRNKAHCIYIKNKAES